jgi:hypothetical protein
LFAALTLGGAAMKSGHPSLVEARIAGFEGAACAAKKR